MGRVRARRRSRRPRRSQVGGKGSRTHLPDDGTPIQELAGRALLRHGGFLSQPSPCQRCGCARCSRAHSRRMVRAVRRQRKACPREKLCWVAVTVAPKVISAGSTHSNQFWCAGVVRVLLEVVGRRGGGRRTRPAPGGACMQSQTWSQRTMVHTPQVFRPHQAGSVRKKPPYDTFQLLPVPVLGPCPRPPARLDTISRILGPSELELESRAVPVSDVGEVAAQDACHHGPRVFI